MEMQQQVHCPDLACKRVQPTQACRWSMASLSQNAWHLHSPLGPSKGTPCLARDCVQQSLHNDLNSLDARQH